MCRLISSALAAALCALLLVGCGGLAPLSSGGGTPQALPVGRWILLDGAKRVEGYPITLDVTEAGVSGTAACNHYNGTLSLSGSGFAVGDLMWTEMGCPAPGVHESERDFLDRLATVTAWQIDSGQLILTGGGTRLLFASVEPEQDAPLTGRWRVESLISGAGPDGTVSTTIAAAHLQLAEGGTFTGRDGCNDLQGHWFAENDVIRFDDFTTTDAACPDPIKPMAEHIIAVLTGWPTYRIEGSSLTLMAGDLGLQLRAD